MPRTKTGKGAGGAGSIRKITTTKNGKTYTYWQGRYTEGFDPGTGKQIQRSITGKTQKEVAQKLKQVTLDIDNGMYHAPCKVTLGQWLDIWTATYLGGVKPRTTHIYKSDIKLHILPALGAVRLEALNAPMIQAFYNAMGEPSQQNPKGLSAKTVKNVHGVLHKALQQAVLIGYLRVQAHCCGHWLSQRPFPRFASLLRSRRDPRRGRHQDSAGKSGPRHCRLHIGRIWPCDRPDEARKCGQNGAVHPVNLRRLTQ